MKYRGKPFLYQAVNILQFIFALKSKVFLHSLGTDSVLQPTSSDLEESAEFAFSFFLTPRVRITMSDYLSLRLETSSVILVRVTIYTNTNVL